MQTPITEAGFTGMAVGAALAGLRPVCEFSMCLFPPMITLAQLTARDHSDLELCHAVYRPNRQLGRQDPLHVWW